MAKKRLKTELPPPPPLTPHTLIAAEEVRGPSKNEYPARWRTVFEGTAYDVVFTAPMSNVRMDALIGAANPQTTDGQTHHQNPSDQTLTPDQLGGLLEDSKAPYSYNLKQANLAAGDADWLETHTHRSKRAQFFNVTVIGGQQHDDLKRVAALLLSHVAKVDECLASASLGGRITRTPDRNGWRRASWPIHHCRGCTNKKRQYSILSSGVPEITDGRWMPCRIRQNHANDLCAPCLENRTLSSEASRVKRDTDRRQELEKAPSVCAAAQVKLLGQQVQDLEKAQSVCAAAQVKLLGQQVLVATNRMDPSEAQQAVLERVVAILKEVDSQQAAVLLGQLLLEHEVHGYRTAEMGADMPTEASARVEGLGGAAVLANRSGHARPNRNPKSKQLAACVKGLVTVYSKLLCSLGPSRQASAVHIHTGAAPIKAPSGEDIWTVGPLATRQKPPTGNREAVQTMADVLGAGRAGVGGPAVALAVVSNTVARMEATQMPLDIYGGDGDGDGAEWNCAAWAVYLRGLGKLDSVEVLVQGGGGHSLIPHGTLPCARNIISRLRAAVDLDPAALEKKVVVSFSADWCNVPLLVGKRAKNGWLFSGQDGVAVAYEANELVQLMKDVATWCKTADFSETVSFVWMCCQGQKIAPQGTLRSEDAFDVCYYEGTHPSGLLPYSGAALAETRGDLVAFVRGHDQAMKYWAAMETAANGGVPGTWYKDACGFGLSKYAGSGIPRRVTAGSRKACTTS